MEKPLNLVVAIFLCFTFLLIESLPVQASTSNQAELTRQVKLLKKSNLAGGCAVPIRPIFEQLHQ